MSSYGLSTSRASRARNRAMQSSTVQNTFMDNSNSHSTVRARSEFVRESPFGGREFGVPDYRSSNIEIRTTSPCLGAGGYYPRTTKRNISITTLHNNDHVPILMHGNDATRGTQLLDKTTAYPATGRESMRYPSHTRRSVTPLSPYLGSYYSSYEHHSPARSSVRFQSSSPLRYSTRPRFQSRFLP